MLNRNLYAVNEGTTPQELAIGNRLDLPVAKVNEPTFNGALSFPQPIICGQGFVTSAGNLGQFLLPTTWMPASGTVKTGTGVYTITHNIGTNRYVPIINLRDTASKNFTVEVNANTTVIRTFTSNTAAAVDTAFMFVFYLNP